MKEDRITFGIAEDEAIEREAMKLFIERSLPNAEVCWLAEDGQAALEAWQREPPDVLIVDIHMPVMDGLSLCEKLLERHSRSVIVINTAYDSFAYARRAIALRAYDYIVKPAQNAELLRTLSACAEEAARRRELDRRRAEHAEVTQSLGRLAVSQLVNRPLDAVASDLYLEPMGWPRAGTYQTRVVHFLFPAAPDAERMQALEGTLRVFGENGWLTASDFVDPRHMVALLDPQTAERPQRVYTLLWCFGMAAARRFDLYIRVGEPCQDKEAIARDCARTPGETRSGYLEIPPRRWRLMRTAESEKLERTMARYLSDGQLPRLRRLLEELRVTLDGPEADWELAQWLFAAAASVWPEQDLLRAAEPMFRLSRREEAWQPLLEAFQRFPEPDNGDVIDRALAIMREEFGGDLSQSALAARLGLEQGYFSRLFKKRTGRNFSEALTELRMRRAEELLLSVPSITLDELCRECGLSSKTYFSEAFKKWKGMTITQFLKTQGR